MKQVDILRVEQNTPFGLVAFCTTPEWDELNYSEIEEWFDKLSLLTFPNNESVIFTGVQPTGACFGGIKRHALITLSEQPFHMQTPSVAYLS